MTSTALEFEKFTPRQRARRSFWHVEANLISIGTVFNLAAQCRVVRVSVMAKTGLRGISVELLCYFFLDL